MSRPIVFCGDCRYSKPEEKALWNLRCYHPEVNRKDSWALSSGTFRGTDCHAERDRISWFSVCGINGKKWEAK
jgi:hypothetical protein